MKKLFKNYGLAFSQYGKAFSFIFKHNLYWYFIFPIIFNIVLWFGGAMLVDSLSMSFNMWLSDALGSGEWTFWGASFLTGAMSWLILIIFKLIFFVLYAFLGGYVILILLSPILAILSEKTEKIATGASYDTDFGQIMKDIIRGVLIALRNMFFETGVFIVMLLATGIVNAILFFIPIIGTILIPIVSFAGSVFMFFVSSYFFGFSYMDYTSERRKLTVKQSISYMRANKGAAMGNGSVFAFSTMIPWCGNFLSSFFAIVSVVAATLTVIELDALEGKGIKIIDNESPKKIQ